MHPRTLLARLLSLPRPTPRARVQSCRRLLERTQRAAVNLLSKLRQGSAALRALTAAKAVDAGLAASVTPPLHIRYISVTYPLHIRFDGRPRRHRHRPELLAAPRHRRDQLAVRPSPAADATDVTHVTDVTYVTADCEGLPRGRRQFGPRTHRPPLYSPCLLAAISYTLFAHYPGPPQQFPPTATVRSPPRPPQPPVAPPRRSPVRLFAPPMVSSAIIFFAGQQPPPPDTFVSATLGAFVVGALLHHVGGGASSALWQCAAAALTLFYFKVQTVTARNALLSEGADCSPPCNST